MKQVSGLSHLLLVGVVSLGLISHDCGLLHAQESRNPLGELFRGIDRGIRRTGEDLERQKSGRDILDSRPIQKSEGTRTFNQAKTYVQQGRYHDAILIYQFLLNESADSFTFQNDRRFHSFLTEVEQQVASLPEEAKRNYLNQFSTTAEQQFRRGVEQQDLEQIRQVALLYGPTPAGGKAIEFLANWYEGRGEYQQAALLWQRLMARSTADELDTARGHAERAWLRAGNLAEARRLNPDVTEADLAKYQVNALPSPTSGKDSVSPFLSLPDQQSSAHEVDPILSARWSVPLIERYRIQDRLNELSTELTDQEIAATPTLAPLVVHRKVAFRSLRSLQVRDLATGNLLWESRRSGSPEERLLGMGTPEFDIDDPEESGDFQVRQLESHRLATLLYRNEVYGSLSSDGRRLFTLEISGDAVIRASNDWNLSGDEDDMRSDDATNELVAYDLETGRQQWRIGGKKIEDQFSRPLAGAYFQGAPVPYGDELFIIGELDGIVTLFSLSPSTGDVLWSQQLATPGRPITADLVRRHWLARPVVADGLILCPTSTGWLTAVELATHRLVWTARFSNRVDPSLHARQRYAPQAIQPLNRRWHATVPVVSQGRVIFTPPELPDEFGLTNPMLFCLDLATGKRLWEQQKSDRPNQSALYVAGHWNSAVILVGTHTVSARNLTGNGELLWSVPLPARPCGRGIIVEDKLLVTTEGGRLVRVNLSQGEIDQIQTLPELETQLGSLTTGDGMLLSLNYSYATAFPLSPQTQLAGADSGQLFKEDVNSARLQLAAGNREAAATALTAAISRPGLTESQRQEVAGLRFELLGQSVLDKDNATDRESLIGEYRELAQSLGRMTDFQRTLSESLMSRREWVPALDLYCELIRKSPLHDTLQDGTRKVRLDAWSGGRLQDLSSQLTPEQRENDLDPRLNELAAQAPQDPAVRDRWARALSFHPAGQRLELQLAEQAFAQGRTGEGLVRCQRVSGGPDAALRVRGLVLQAQRLASLGWHQDAAQCWKELQSRIESWPEEQKAPLQKLAETGLETAQKQEATAAVKSPWSGAWAVERLGLTGNESAVTTVAILGAGYEKLRSLRFLLDVDQLRTRVEDRSSGEFLGSFPIRQMSHLEFQPAAVARLQGPYAMIVHRGTLQAMDWATRQLIWTWQPELKGPSLGRMNTVQPFQHQVFVSVSQFLVSQQNAAHRDQAGYLVSGNNRVLLLLCRDWIALDPITGEELWRDTKAPDRAYVASLGADRFAVFGRGAKDLRRAIDGSQIADELQLDLISRTFAVLDQDYVLLRRHQPADSSAATVALQRLSGTGEIRWQRELPMEAMLVHPDNESLMWISPDNELFLVNLKTGDQTRLMTVTVRGRNHSAPVQVLTDAGHFFVITDNGGHMSSFMHLSGISVTGVVNAFDRSGKQLWSYEPPLMKSTAGSSPRRRADGQRWRLKLLTPEFADSPLMVLAADVHDEFGELSYHRLKIIGLDKNTGMPLVDWDQPSESGGISYLHVDLEQRHIELRTYSERIRILPQSLKQAPQPPQESQ